MLLMASIQLWAEGQGEEAYPDDTITIVVPWAEGGGTDLVARFWADALQDELDTPVVVQNRTGGSGAVGHTAGATATPDGYTMAMVTFELATFDSLGIADLTYDEYEYAFQMNEDAAGVIVRDDSEWETIGDLIDYIEANPGEVQFSGTGSGGVWDLARAGMLIEAGIDPDDTTWIPSEGAAPAITDLLGGNVDVITNSLPEAQSQLESGDLRALAVMSDERNETFPDVPTLQEEGIDWTAGTWRGFAFPGGTPDEVIQLIIEAGEVIAESEEFQQFMGDQGFGIRTRYGSDFRDFVREEAETWETVIEEVGF